MTHSDLSYSVDDALRDLQAIVDEQRHHRRGGSEEYPQISEEDHVRADAILLKLIDHQLVTELFERVGKWYS